LLIRSERIFGSSAERRKTRCCCRFVPIRDKSRIREIFANSLAAIIGGKQALSLSGSEQDEPSLMRSLILARL
jgi:hypothetical protein